MAKTIYLKLRDLMARNPELGRFKRTLTGSCCSAPDDQRLRARIKKFLVEQPQFQELLGPFLVE
jgi:hypothetical protein